MRTQNNNLCNCSKEFSLIHLDQLGQAGRPEQGTGTSHRSVNDVSGRNLLSILMIFIAGLFYCELEQQALQKLRKHNRSLQQEVTQKAQQP